MPAGSLSFGEHPCPFSEELSLLITPLWGAQRAQRLDERVREALDAWLTHVSFHSCRIRARGTHGGGTSLRGLPDHLEQCVVPRCIVE